MAPRPRLGGRFESAARLRSPSVSWLFCLEFSHATFFSAAGRRACRGPRLWGAGALLAGRTGRAAAHYRARAAADGDLAGARLQRGRVLSEGGVEPGRADPGPTARPLGPVHVHVRTG